MIRSSRAELWCILFSGSTKTRALVVSVGTFGSVPLVICLHPWWITSFLRWTALRFWSRRPPLPSISLFIAGWELTFHSAVGYLEKYIRYDSFQGQRGWRKRVTRNGCVRSKDGQFMLLSSHQNRSGQLPTTGMETTVQTMLGSFSPNYWLVRHLENVLRSTVQIPIINSAEAVSGLVCCLVLPCVSLIHYLWYYSQHSSAIYGRLSIDFPTMLSKYYPRS